MWLGFQLLYLAGTLKNYFKFVLWKVELDENGHQLCIMLFNNEGFQINATVFNTTAVDNGRINGTYTIMENLLQSPVVWLACGNYLHEIILRSVQTN